MKPTSAKLTRAEAGKLGGQAKSRAKTKAARLNAKLGGRPRKDKPPGPVVWFW